MLNKSERGLTGDTIDNLILPLDHEENKYEAKTPIRENPMMKESSNSSV